MCDQISHFWNLVNPDPEISESSSDRFSQWQYPEIVDGQPTKYNWVVQNTEKFKLGYKTDIGAFSYINAKYGVTIEDFVQIGSHCSIYSVSTIDDKQGQVTLCKNARRFYKEYCLKNGQKGS